MSTHAVRIVEITEIQPHANAERLEIIPIGGWQAVARKGQFRVGDRAVYIEPDYVVPTGRPEFSFLAKDGKDTHRLKAVRLRGSLSFGLLIELPAEIADRSVGDDVMEPLGISRYVPPTRPFKGGGDMQQLAEASWPTVYAPRFDIESLLNNPHILAPGERVLVTEKVDGANARFVSVDGTLYIGSRLRWLKPEADNIWSRALAATPQIVDWCRAYDRHVLYGEVYGPVQSLTYGLREPRFVAFAALSPDGVWTSAWQHHDVPQAPLLYAGPYDLEEMKRIVETDSRLCDPGHMMEGVVITSVPERTHPDIGRVALKLISNRFWESEA